ncbi:MAG: MFS transporter [Steroidobacteraceae bacterium]|jgi:BCD family chlorophyll transporter-like MFS transporter
MSRFGERLARKWMRIGTEFLPFADAASAELPLGRLLRLSLFQVSVGIAMVLLIGTLNRVLIVELGVPAWLVSLMVGLPLIFAPFRALIGFRSDNHRSALGWRRVPYIWMGTLLQFGGLAIMPFALVILSGDTHGPLWIGQFASAFAFLLVGAGLQTTQTAGLALATDLAPEAVRPRVIALMYAMLLVGMVASGLAFGRLLANFSEIRLIQVIQGAAVMTMLLNLTALWKQEARNPVLTSVAASTAKFRDSWREFIRHRRAVRFLVAVGLGTAAFNMQDIVLEPYGGEILHLTVGATTALTAMLAGGALAAFSISARLLGHGADPYRLAAYGAVMGLFAFAAVIFAAPLGSAQLFRLGTLLIGFGGGFFSVGTLAGAMARERNGESGLALGAWGAVQATSAGLAIALGGAVRDAVTSLATHGALGPAMTGAATGYSVVYHIEIALLFATLVAIGPLVRTGSDTRVSQSGDYKLAEFPN